MQPRKKLPQRLVRLALATTTLVSTTVAPILNGFTPSANAASVTAKQADAFVDSMCVNTHLGYPNTPYGSNYSGFKQKLVELGIRHIRDGGSSADWIAKAKELASLGIKINYIMLPSSGVAPNSTYWSNSPNYTINDFVKNKVGTNVINAVEILNEIDLFHDKNGGFYWKKGDTQKINDDPNSPLYWAKYARSMTQDTWKALKNDPATAGVKVIAPSLARFYEYGSVNPLGDLSAYIDWGNFHPYPFGGNSYGGYFAYNTLKLYYLHGNFPSVNIDEYPFSLDVYSRSSGSKPIAATETGYFTNSNYKGVSEKVHAKYMPRLFLEYFRKGIARTCTYEFLNEWNDSKNDEANFGLLRNDLSPKPAYTALKNLIALLKDPGNSFTPGSLDYTITVNPPAQYNRTQYVHSLLLQKRNGKFYLAIWHDISNIDTSVTPSREINPPDMPTTITFKTPIGSASQYKLMDDGSMATESVTLTNNTISLKVKDRVKVLELTPKK